MKTKSLLVPFLLSLSVLACIALPLAMTSPIDRQSVNPILGDLSFENEFGQAPASSTDENLRIRTHLAYVEGRLRNLDVTGMSAHLQGRRTQVLDLLRDYWTAGVFPKNYDHPGERRPCFIDRDGTICAVGYLVAQTAGRVAAEAINQKHQYKDLLAMNDASLDAWVAESGLSKLECAMIQPTYGWTDPNNNYVSPGLSIATAGFTGFNAALCGLNGLQLLKGNQRRAIPVIGLVAGAGQVILGVAMTPGQPIDNWGPPYPERQHLFSMMNVGLGTSTMVLSAYNLLANRKPKENAVSWNVYGYPTNEKNVAMGFSLSKRF